MSGEIMLSVVIPVFNERDALPVTLARVAAAPFDKEVVIVDDGSTDGTRDYLDALQQGKESVKGLSQDRLSITFQAANCGKGAALRTGFAQARGKFILIQDADLEYDPADYPQLLEPLVSGRADVVYGTRLAGGGAHRVLYFWHSLGNRLLTILSNMMTDLNLTDMETGYKAFRRDLLPRLVLKSNRFGVEPELTARFSRMKARMYEVPISYYGRTYSEGKKIGWKDGIAAFFHIIRFRFF
jgi:glycosyltransferase involved in cell wall biosynthesis